MSSYPRERSAFGSRTGGKSACPSIGSPLSWPPPPKERRNWRLIGHGIGIHWPDLDEDISVPALLK